MGREPGPSLRSHLLITCLLAALVLGGGAFAAGHRAAVVDARMREAQLRQAVAVAEALHPDLLARLSFTHADRGTPAFEQLREQLTVYARAIDARGIYTMVLREGALIFGPESYADDDPMASTPGTIYREPAPDHFEVFAEGRARIFGPVRDEFGTFVSAVAPAFDRRTGEVQIAVGIDVLAEAWRAEVNASRRVPWLIACLFLVLSLLLVWGSYWRDRYGGEAGWLWSMDGVLAGLLGLTLTVAAVFSVGDAETYERVNIAASSSVARAEAVADAFREIETNLGAVARFHASSDYVDCDEFSRFVAPLAATAVVQGYRWVPVVPADERVAFEAAARAEGLTDYEIWQRGPAGERLPPTGREIHYPNRCAAPSAYNEAVIGLDLGADPVRRAALEEAARTGLVTATDAVPLIVSADSEPGMLVLAPVYSPGPGSSEGEMGIPGELPRGYVAAAVRLQSVLDLTLRPFVDRGAALDLHLVDPTGEEGWLILAAHPNAYTEPFPFAVDEAHAEPYETTGVYPLFVYGRPLILVTHTLPDFRLLFPLRTSWVVGIMGTLLSAMLGLIIGLLRVRQASLEGQVRERTAELGEREEKYRRLAESTSAVLWEYDILLDRWTYVAPQVEALVGYTPSEWTDLQFWTDHLHPEDRTWASMYCAECTARGEAHTFEYRFLAKDGSAVWLRDVVSVEMRDETPIKLRGFMIDLTERKQAEERQQRQLEELTLLHGVASACAAAGHEDDLIVHLTRLISEALYTDDFGFLMAEEDGVLHPHASYRQASGRPTETIRPGEGVVGQVVAEGRPRRVDDARLEDNFLDDSPTCRSELAVPVRFGERVIAVINAESPEVGHFTGADERLLVTIADQVGMALARLRLAQQTQRRLTELEALHRASREIMAAGVNPEVVYESVHRVVESLMPAEAFVIVLRDPVTGENEAVYAYDKGGRWPVLRAPGDAGLSGYVINRGEAVLIHTASQQRPFRVVHYGTSEQVESSLAVPLRANERIIGMVSAQSYRQHAYTRHDMILLETLANHVAAGLDNIRLFHETQEQVQRVQAILDSVPEGVMLLDAEGHIVLADAVAAREIGALVEVDDDEVLVRLGERPLAELLTSPPEGLWHEVTVGERAFEVIARPVKGGPEPESYIMVISDVTHERQVRHELQRQERLAAVGQLAAGIAHDFNNILAVIALYAQMDVRAPDLPPRFRAHLQTISEQSQHAARLVQQILDFGRRAMLAPRPMDLVPFLQEQLALLARTLPESVRIELDLEVTSAPVLADVTRMQQMLTNLAVNARDAMPDGGVLTVALCELMLERRGAGPLPEMASGSWLKLEVRDTGCGIASEVLEHLFEPFYTTKEPGQGTGLGLAQVYGIVRQHRGHVGVATEVGKGTTFTIYLPTLEGVKPAEQRAAARGFAQGHGQTVLVVEDNVQVREAVVGALELLNYRTLEAGDGREALVILERQGEEIAVVLSDLVMPEMGGQALFHAMAERGLTVPMIFLSGHPVRDDLLDLPSRGPVGWLAKPPEIESLAETLARALSQASEA